jgi:hypothetical protein
MEEYETAYNRGGDVNSGPTKLRKMILVGRGNSLQRVNELSDLGISFLYQVQGTPF